LLILKSLFPEGEMIIAHNLPLLEKLILSYNGSGAASRGNSPSSPSLAVITQQNKQNHQQKKKVEENKGEEKSFTNNIWWEEIVYVIEIVCKFLNLQMKKEHYQNNNLNNTQDELIVTGKLICESLLALLLSPTELKNYSKEVLFIILKSFNLITNYSMEMTGIFLNILLLLPQEDVFFILNITNLNKLSKQANTNNAQDNNHQAISATQQQKLNGKPFAFTLPNCIGYELIVDPISYTWNSMGIAKLVDQVLLELHSAQQSLAMASSANLLTPSNAVIHQLSSAHPQEFMTLLLQLFYSALKTNVEHVKRSSNNSLASSGSNNNNAAATAHVINPSLLSNAWIEIYQNLKTEILHGFLSSTTILLSMEILTFYLIYSNLQENIFNDSKFQELIKSLYSLPSGGGSSEGKESKSDKAKNDSSNDNKKSNSEEVAICQYFFERFLKDIFKIGKPYNQMIVNMIQLFAKNNSSLFTHAVNLVKVQKDFGTQLNNEK
jgi:hypothetical protein